MSVIITNLKFSVLLFLFANCLIVENATGQQTDSSQLVKVGHEGIFSSTTTTKESIKKNFNFSVGTAGVLAFSGLNANVTGEVTYGRHIGYLGPKLSVADAYLPSTAPFGFVAGYKFYVNNHHSIQGKFDFFVLLDYQFQNHKAFRSNNNLPKRYNSLHELNAGYGLQYNISKRLAVNNVLAFGRYLEIFRNPKSGTETKFDGYDRMLRVQLLYRIR